MLSLVQMNNGSGLQALHEQWIWFTSITCVLHKCYWKFIFFKIHLERQQLKLNV